MSKSKLIVLASAVVAAIATVTVATPDAEARGFSGGRAGSFRAPAVRAAPAFRPATSFRAPIGKLRAPIVKAPNIKLPKPIKLPPGLKPNLPKPTIPHVPKPGPVKPKPGPVKPLPPPTTVQPLPPKYPGKPVPPPYYGGGTDISIDIGSAAAAASVAVEPAVSACSYPLRMWTETGTNVWKDRYYSCMGY